MSDRKQEYAEYLKSPHWRSLRAEKHKRSARGNGGVSACAVCRATENLHIHHVRYLEWWNVQTKHLRVVCKDCHSAAHEILNLGFIRPRSGGKEWGLLSREIRFFRGLDPLPKKPKRTHLARWYRLPYYWGKWAGTRGR